VDLAFLAPLSAEQHSRVLEIESKYTARSFRKSTSERNFYDCAFGSRKSWALVHWETEVYFGFSTQSSEWSDGGAIPRRFIL
jgi:hypothetical protein